MTSLALTVPDTPRHRDTEEDSADLWTSGIRRYNWSVFEER